jgi:subtilisin family serine protease
MGERRRRSTLILGVLAMLRRSGDDETVRAVAASDCNDAIASYSCYGPEIDVAAPGDWIFCILE